MQFKLFFKSYNCKPSLGAMKAFKEATGLDMWASLSSYMGTFAVSVAEGVRTEVALERLAGVLDFVDASQLFYCIAKQANSALTIDEIEDAMFRCGILKSDRDSDMSEPYPFVLYKLALDVNDYHMQLAKDSKKP
tara:strand:+ start:874 stop:1278 length:405 start_codon:yes stop_codon:yes gene_type:complete